MVQPIGLKSACYAFFIILIQSCYGETANRNQKTELVMLTMMFRHGNRGPDLSELLATPGLNTNIDNKTLESVGFGQLTNQGKLRLYNNGVLMRKLYGDFLGDSIVDGDVIPYTTLYPRTGASLLAFMAGLLPPAKSEQWDNVPNNINCRDPGTCHLSEHTLLPKLWNPIPYIFDPKLDDELRLHLRCPAYHDEFFRALSLPEIKGKVEAFDDLLKYVSMNTGYKNMDFIKLNLIFNALSAEANIGFEIPLWAQHVWNDFLAAMDLFSEITHHTDKAKQISGGLITRRILQDMVAKCKQELVPKNRKLFIYSGHDITVAPLLACLGGQHGYINTQGELHPPTNPPYGATVIIELHRNLFTNEHLVKILYYDYKSPEPQPLKIVGCDLMCPLEKLIELTKATTISKVEFDAFCPVLRDNPYYGIP